jgi:superfamily II DNA or RNA helicase
LFIIATHKRTWEEELQKTNHKYEFVTYKSLHNKLGKSYTGIILDEAHHLTDSSLVNLIKIKADYKIALSGTIPQNKRILIQKWATNAKVNKIDIKQAIRSGLLPSPRILLCPVSIANNQESFVFKKMRNEGYPWKHITYADYMSGVYHTQKANLAIKTNAQQYLDLLNGEIDFWKEEYFEKREEWMKDVKWMKLAGDRKKFLNKLKDQTIQAIHQILVEQDKRFLVFSGSLESIKKLTTSSIVYYNNGVGANNAIINQFNNGDANRLYSVDILNESVNLEAIEVVVIGSLNNIQVTNFQRLGRSLRGQEPIIVVPFIRGTQDEKNLHKFLEDMGEFITVAKTKNEVRNEILKQS